ncbi:putative glutaredoxin NrdH [Rhodococcus sp. AW25M09]|nr:putative glutaredoxin NrdH [Rhodococcus sp. AW25M09]
MRRNETTTRQARPRLPDCRTVDIREDDTARHFVTCELGYLQAPVVVVDEDTHWSGFRIDALDKLAAA